MAVFNEQALGGTLNGNVGGNGFFSGSGQLWVVGNAFWSRRQKFTSQSGRILIQQVLIVE